MEDAESDWNEEQSCSPRNSVPRRDPFLLGDPPVAAWIFMAVPWYAVVRWKKYSLPLCLSDARYIHKSFADSTSLR